MSKVRVASFGVSLDGFSAGPNQNLANPLGEGGPALFQWFFPTQTFGNMHGNPGGTTGPDNDFALAGFHNIGAWILGRNMFSPIRGPWPNEDWKGWWGDTPPYHVPVFVLTHHARPSFTLADTTFHFVTEGIHAALDQARAAANGKDIRIGGGPATIRQYLQAQLIDELHLAVAPTLLGQGEPLFYNLNLPALGYQVIRNIYTPAANHISITKQPE